MKIKKPFRIIKDLYCRFQDDDLTALGAQLTYFLLLSFFPFLIFLLTLVSYTPLTGLESLNTLSRLLPSNTYNAILKVLDEIISPNRVKLLSFGMIFTLWVASNGVEALIRGINKAYDQEETRPFWKVKWISFLFTLELAAIILVSFVTLVFGEALGTYLFDFLGVPQLFILLWDLVRYFMPLLTMMLVFISLYHTTPNYRLPIKDVIPGAIFSTVSWIVISIIFSFYVNNFGNFSKTYGSIGGVIGLLIWLYWSSIMILLGGELNASLAFDREGRKKPKCKRF